MVANEWPASGIAGFTRGFTTVDGTRIHHVTGGRPDGEVLVLFAGFPQSWYAWRKILPALGERYRIVAPDLPGQGDSDRPRAGCDTAGIAKIVRKLLDKLDVGSHFLVAHDIGAWVAYPYAALNGASVKGLAILDTGIQGSASGRLMPGMPKSPGVLGMSRFIMCRTCRKLSSTAASTSTFVGSWSAKRPIRRFSRTPTTKSICAPF